MPKQLLDKNNNLLYSGYETDEIVANPQLDGTETDLQGLQIGNAKYKVPQGGGSVESDVLKVQIGYNYNWIEEREPIVEQIYNWDIYEALLEGKMVVVSYKPSALHPEFTCINYITAAQMYAGEEENTYRFRLAEDELEEDRGIRWNQEQQVFEYYSHLE